MKTFYQFVEQVQDDARNMPSHEFANKYAAELFEKQEMLAPPENADQAYGRVLHALGQMRRVLSDHGQPKTD
jgi:hypothetical protein